MGVLALIDDQRLVRKVVGGIFRQGGERLLPYGITAFEAFESADRFRGWLDDQAVGAVHVMIVDYRLGRIHTGVDLAVSVHGHRGLAPQVVRIGWSRQADAADRFEAAGFDGFISKERDFGTLMADIAAVCSSQAVGVAWTCLR